MRTVFPQNENLDMLSDGRTVRGLHLCVFPIKTTNLNPVYTWVLYSYGLSSNK